MRTAEAGDCATDLVAQFPDENVDYYVVKLDELVKKFNGITTEASSAKQASLRSDRYGPAAYFNSVTSSESSRRLSKFGSV